MIVAFEAGGHVGRYSKEYFRYISRKKLYLSHLGFVIEEVGEVVVAVEAGGHVGRYSKEYFH